MTINNRFNERIKAHLFASAEIKRRVFDQSASLIFEAASQISLAFKSGNKLLLCGNGGSAADCQHMATEFVSRLTIDFDRKSLPALALTTDTSFLTAFANDCGFEGLFERQVAAFGKPGDILLGISTSGSSKNVIRALSAAKNLGMSTIGLVGEGGKLGDLCDTCISVPSKMTQYIQEAHLAIEHIICDLVECLLFDKA